MKLLDSIKGACEVATVWTKAHAPEICEVSGLILGATSTVLAIRAGIKIKEKGIVDDYKKELDEIDTQLTSKVNRGSQKIKVTVTTGAKVSKELVLPVAVGAAAGVVNHLGYSNLRSQIGLLTTALAEVSIAQQQLQDRLKNEFGEEEGTRLTTDSHYEVTQHSEINDKGEAVIVNDQIMVVDLDKLPPNMLVYSETTTHTYGLNVEPLHFKNLIENVEANAHSIMAGYKHHVFLDEALKPLSIYKTDTAYYRTHGSILPTDRQVNDLHGGVRPENMGTFDIGYKPIVLKHDDGTTEKGWLLDVKCDGLIIDKFEKYLH